MTNTTATATAAARDAAARAAIEADNADYAAVLDAMTANHGGDLLGALIAHVGERYCPRCAA
jgi:hypothetical protein